MLDQYRLIRCASEYYAPADGKQYRLFLRTRNGQAFVVDDFDDLQEAQIKAASIEDPTHELTVTNRHSVVIRNAGTANAKQPRTTYSSAQPISVSRLCGLEPKKTAYRRRRW